MKSQKKLKKTEKYIKITYLTKKEGKTIRMNDFELKLTLNHLSSIEKKKKNMDY